MTGYGYKELQTEEVHISLELKAYNNRYLDILINISSYFNAFEPRIRDFIAGSIGRGRVEASLRIHPLSEKLSIDLDPNNVDSYVSVLKKLRDRAGLQDEIHLSHLLRMEGILKTEQSFDREKYWPLVEKLLSETNAELEESRKKEGEATKASILSFLDSIEADLENIKSFVPKIEEQLKKNITERFHEVLGNEVDENRILSEIAMLLVKYSIDEEVVRMGIHVDSFRKTTENAGNLGKKLDFIAQELNREINTIGSKSIIVDINQYVIEIKDSLEKIREQLRNVE